MAKDTYYFSHDYNARNDEKVLELRSNFGAEGYGLFWMLLESMAETEDGKLNLSLIGGLSLGYGVAKERLKEVIDFCINVDLFQQELQFFCSKRMVEHKNFRKELSQQGKDGADKRWGKNRGDIAPLKVGNGDPNAKERKGKEIKGKSVHNEIWLDETAKAYRTTPEVLKLFCEDWLGKADAKGTIEKYDVPSVTRFMLDDFESNKKIEPQKKQKFLDE